MKNVVNKHWHRKIIDKFATAAKVQLLKRAPDVTTKQITQENQECYLWFDASPYIGIG